MSAYKFLSKNGTLLAFGAVVVLTLIAMIPIFMGYSAFDSIATEKQAFSPEGNIFMLGLKITIGLLVIAILAAVVLSIFQILSNPKAAMKGLLALAIIAVLFFVFYAMTDQNVTGPLRTTIDSFKITPGTYGVISGGIQLTLVMLVASVAVAIIMEIWNYFKNQ